ncbi:hypothetical protein CEXT_435311 [Caerostris extrusa]|uniref:LAGLIDADG homing endonuclease n=1 Tax=Caerostris extrusa TaxID=172846 RepID=A0AAV4SR55_CAEEX|nr:hypothetical protein CEXT_435311 [Caerostris extrusa]
MESIGAHRIFSRSVKSRQLKYTIYYGDGDSKGFFYAQEICKNVCTVKTQNANESFNGTLWQRVSKEVFVWLKTVKLRVYDAAIQFNEGYMGCLKVSEKLNIENPGFLHQKATNILITSEFKNPNGYQQLM